MRGFDLATPTSLEEASRLLDTDDSSVRAWSGGTALMLMMKSGVFKPSRLVVLSGVGSGHAEIAATADGGLRIGALATLANVERSADVARVAPTLARAMTRLSNPRVRNVARVGGALAHGDPHMDLPPVLAALRGEVVTIAPNGGRVIAIEDLFLGYYETALERGELIAEARLPSQAGWSSIYVKCTTRTADDWPALGVAISTRVVDGVVADARIVVSAATEKLTRVRAAEDELRGAALDETRFSRVAEALAANIETVDDARGSAAYKSELARVHARRALRDIAEGRAA